MMAEMPQSILANSPLLHLKCHNASIKNLYQAYRTANEALL